MPTRDTSRAERRTSTGTAWYCSRQLSPCRMPCHTSGQAPAPPRPYGALDETAIDQWGKLGVEPVSPKAMRLQRTEATVPLSIPVTAPCGAVPFTCVPAHRVAVEGSVGQAPRLVLVHHLRLMRRPVHPGCPLSRWQVLPLLFSGTGRESLLSCSGIDRFCPSTGSWVAGAQLGPVQGQRLRGLATLSPGARRGSYQRLKSLGVLRSCLCRSEPARHIAFLA